MKQDVGVGITNFKRDLPAKQDVGVGITDFERDFGKWFTSYAVPEKDLGPKVDIVAKRVIGDLDEDLIARGCIGSRGVEDTVKRDNTARDVDICPPTDGKVTAEEEAKRWLVHPW